MTYFLRLFTTSDVVPDPEALLDGFVTESDADIEMTVEGEEEAVWDEITLHANDKDICFVERTMKDDELFAEEMAAFEAALADAKPASGADWVREQLKKTQVIYACQILDGGFEENLAELPGDFLWALKSTVGGLIQADGEGFSNEEGRHVVWMFEDEDELDGPWNMALLDDSGGWVRFEMDLGNQDHRRAFLAGKVPEGVEIATVN